MSFPSQGLVVVVVVVVVVVRLAIEYQGVHMVFKAQVSVLS